MNGQVPQVRRWNREQAYEERKRELEERLRRKREQELRWSGYRQLGGNGQTWLVFALMGAFMLYGFVQVILPLLQGTAKAVFPGQ